MEVLLLKCFAVLFHQHSSSLSTVLKIVEKQGRHLTHQTVGLLLFKALVLEQIVVIGTQQQNQYQDKHCVLQYITAQWFANALLTVEYIMKYNQSYMYMHISVMYLDEIKERLKKSMEIFSL